MANISDAEVYSILQQKSNQLFADIMELSTNPDEYEDFINALDSFGWRKLGSELGFTVSQLNKFQKEKSPTREMMTAWVTKDETLDELVTALRAIDHFTAAKALAKYVQ